MGIDERERIPPLPSRPISAGLIVLPTLGDVPWHVSDDLVSRLERLMADIPPDKRGQARLVFDVPSLAAAQVGLEVGAHAGSIGPVDIDVAVGVGYQRGRGGQIAGEVRLVWD